MVKAHSTFTIDSEVINKASAAGINLSLAAENGIRHALIRMGGDVKTADEIAIEREIKERQERVKKAEEAAKIEADKALAAAQGKIYVDENSPAQIEISQIMKRIAHAKK